MPWEDKCIQYELFNQFSSSSSHIFSTSVKTVCRINWIPLAFPLLITGGFMNIKSISRSPGMRLL